MINFTKKITKKLTKKVTKKVTFRSIRTQIVTSTSLLIIGLVGAIITVWANSESTLFRQEKLNDAKSVTSLLGYMYSDTLSEENWSQVRLNVEVLMRENPDLVYVFVTDSNQDNIIVAASSEEFQDNYIPDIVPLNVTELALKSSHKVTKISETYILRDVYFSGELRAKTGEKVIEVSTEIRSINGGKIGNLRLGISLKDVNRVVGNAVNKALTVGAVGLVFGWVCAYILAQQLSYPIRRLEASVDKIAAGDLEHQVNIGDRKDEIGKLAIAFNEMSMKLQISFSKLQKTLHSFERFVPNKFISVIAPEGIENIEVGITSVRNMTILFSDIRGYTSMSEAMQPIEIFTFLNDYLACMGSAINDAGGFIDKYIGDAIMALFDDDYTDSALRAAIWMQQSLQEFNFERSQKGLPNIAIGIGIHRGEVVMGTVGFTSRIDSTVIGDAVNAAFRIEGLTKQYQCSILVTESVVNSLLSPESFTLELVDKAVKVKGKDEKISIYELKY